jgi:hypothetical protein
MILSVLVPFTLVEAIRDAPLSHILKGCQPLAGGRGRKADTAGSEKCIGVSTLAGVAALLHPVRVR